MNNYSILFSDGAKADLPDMILGESPRRAPDDAADIMAEFESACWLLGLWPKKFAAIDIDGRTYRHFAFKTHMVYYRVVEDRRHVLIDAIMRRESAAPTLPGAP